MPVKGNETIRIAIKRRLVSFDRLGFLASGAAYKQRMGIEEMFLDYKTGRYNLEGNGLRGERLIKIILLMAIVDRSAIFEGTEMSKKNRCKNMYFVVNTNAKNTVN